MFMKVSGKERAVGIPMASQSNCVEKELGIIKEDIGTKISAEEYNQKCREAYWCYKDKWDDITRKWVIGSI
jgi:isoleucyl-tRNA synthetase